MPDFKAFPISVPPAPPEWQGHFAVRDDGGDWRRRSMKQESIASSALSRHATKEATS